MITTLTDRHIVAINSDEWFPCKEHGGAHQIRRITGTTDKGKIVSITQCGSEFNAEVTIRRSRYNDTETYKGTLEQVANWLYRVLDRK